MLQSAGMGGYGVAVVNAFVPAGAVEWWLTEDYRQAHD